LKCSVILTTTSCLTGISKWLNSFHSASPTIALSASVEASAYDSASACTTLGLVSLAAAEAEEDSARTPLEVVAVVDRSGSMRGEKIEMMIRTLQFLVSQGLQSNDRFGLVTFETAVEAPLELTSMDSAGKKKATEIISGLRVGGQTNLSGGLLRGIDMQMGGGSTTATRAVLLFTDGMANQGISGTQGILDAAQGAMASSPCTIFTFGFGRDHNEDLLRSLAESMPGAPGLYYYLQGREAIPQAFADCLGGLVSVVAQNAQLRLKPCGDASLGRALGSHKAEVEANGELVVALGDLYSEDEKDVLFEMTLPTLLAPVDAAAPVAEARLRFFDVRSSSMVEVDVGLAVSRPAVAPPVEQQPVNMRLDEQRTRVLAAEAMARAARLADEGRLDEGREVLTAEIGRAKASKTAASPLTSALVGDMEAVRSGYASEAQYYGYGQKMSKMTASSYHMQRSNHCSAQVYSKASKMGMRRRFVEAEQALPTSAPAAPQVAPQAAATSRPSSPRSKAIGKKKAGSSDASSPSGGALGWLRKSFSTVKESKEEQAGGSSP